MSELERFARKNKGETIIVACKTYIICGYNDFAGYVILGCGEDEGWPRDWSTVGDVFLSNHLMYSYLLFERAKELIQDKL